MAATSIGQYVTRFHTASRTSTSTSNADMPVMTDHTWSRSAMRGRMLTNTPIAIAGKSAIWTALSTRRLADDPLDRVSFPFAPVVLPDIPAAYRPPRRRVEPKRLLFPVAVPSYTRTPVRYWSLVDATDTDDRPALAGFAERATARRGDA